MKSGIERIAAERQRQISPNGEAYNDSHDDQHVASELVRAAICYALPPGPLREQNLHGEQLPRFWPWQRDVASSNQTSDKGPAGSAWKPMQGAFTIEGRIRELEKAGALIAAEIDRLQRPAAEEFHTSVAEREAAEAKELAEATAGTEHANEVLQKAKEHVAQMAPSGEEAEPRPASAGLVENRANPV